MDYSTLITDAQKQEILNARIQQFASEAYQHNLNKMVAESSGNQEAVVIADNSIAILDSAITVHQAELAKLSVEVPVV